jgi:hypothetical protein
MFTSKLSIFRTSNVAFRAGVEFREMPKLSARAITAAWATMLGRGLGWCNGPLLFNLENAGQRYFERLAILAGRWDAKRPGNSAALHQRSHPGNADTPAFGQLAGCHSFEVCGGAGHRITAVRHRTDRREFDSRRDQGEDVKPSGAGSVGVGKQIASWSFRYVSLN